MINGETVPDVSTLEEAENEFSAGNTGRDETVAETRGREDWGWGIGGVKTMTSLRVGHTRAAHSFRSCFFVSFFA